MPAEGLALVARDADGHVIGTVRLWNVEAGVNREGQSVPALLLGPLAVDPAHEGKGIGGIRYRNRLFATLRKKNGQSRTYTVAYRGCDGETYVRSVMS